jgi:hypothetical protein
MAAVHLQMEPEALRPLIELVIGEVLARVEEERTRLNGRIAYSEPEAAALLGLQSHQLRDERRRGQIQASEIVGKRIRYTRQDLLDYLASRRWRK